jgi:N-acetylneuraminic acid mutarotase
MPHRQNEAATAAVDGRIYVMGGFEVDSTKVVPLVQVYDVAKNEWSEGIPLPEPLHHAAAAVVGGKIYLIGGFRNNFAQREPVDTVWMFDPAANTWEKRAPLPAARGALWAAAIGDRIYAAGGEHYLPGAPPPKPGERATYEPVADFAVYDTTSDRWETLPPMHYRRDHVLAAAINGRFYAVGGRDRPKYDLAVMEEYDPAARAWTERAPMPTGRSGGNGAVLNGQFYIFGGEGNPASPLGVYGEVEAFDPATNSWKQFGPMPVPRHSLSAAAVGDRIYLPGGAPRRGGAEVIATVDAFQP